MLLVSTLALAITVPAILSAEQMIQKQNSNWLLPAVLSTTAGATDVISFLALGGLFTRSHYR